MPLYMETTQVEAAKTVNEIQELLARRGASSIMVDYANGQPVSVAFRLKVEEQQIPFRLPCRFEAVERILRRLGKKPRKRDDYESWARRVAWRQILYWVKAQVALIETGMVKTQEVFLPYAIVENQTLYDAIASRKFLALPAPKAAEADAAS